MSSVNPFEQVGNPSAGVSPLNSYDVIPALSGSTFPAAGNSGSQSQLAPVNVSSYNLDNANVLDSLSGNPFAGDTGGAPLTDMNFSPDLTSSSDLTGLDSIPAGAGGLGTPAAGSPSNSLNGLLGGTSNLLGDAAMLGLGAYGISQAKSAQAQTESEIAPLKSESSNLLNLSKSLTQQYQSGTLPAWAQQYTDWTSQEATNLINAAPTQALEAIATQNFTDYSSGNLKPADQTALNEQVAAEKQQVAGQLAATGNEDSSVLAAWNQQIDQNAAVTRQSILNSYFQTGDTAYNAWINTNTQATQIKTLGAQFAQQTFANMMSSALQAANVGDQALTQAVGLELQSDNELSQTLGSLMQSIASAFSYQAYMSRAGGAGGVPGAGGGGTGSLVGSIVGGIENYGGAAVKGLEGLFGGSSVAGLSSSWGSGAAADSALAQEGFSSAGGQAAAGAPSAASGGASGSTALGMAGKAIAGVGAAYSLYNEVKDWQSGSTGSDALQGAETGASIGSFFGPVGFVVGGLLGGAAGAISSAFGGGKTDPETLNWDNYASQANANPQIASTLTPAQAYQLLAGNMDASGGGKQPIESVFGRMGEGNLVTQMTQQINASIRNNPTLAQQSPEFIYNDVVVPWLASKGASIQNRNTVKGVPEGPALSGVLQQIVALWQDGQLNSSTPVGVSGQTVNVPAFGA